MQTSNPPYAQKHDSIICSYITAAVQQQYATVVNVGRQTQEKLYIDTADQLVDWRLV